MGWIFTWALVGGLAPRPSAAPTQPDPCDELYRALDAVPHVTLTRRPGPLDSVWRGEPAAACQVDFQTNEATLDGAAAPDFFPNQGTPMYRAGWRMIPEILADGAGSGVYGIRRGSVRCVIQWDQPAYLDDDGDIVQSETFTMLVQCSGGPPEP